MSERLLALVGKRVVSVDTVGEVAITLVFDDGTELDVDARTDLGSGVLDWDVRNA